MDQSLERLKISRRFHPFLENLSQNALNQDRIPFINRTVEIETILETLLRKLKNNVLLVGRPGVGKTAIITELAAMIHQREVPASLKNRLILELSLNRFFYSKNTIESLIEDLGELFSEIKRQRHAVILVLDDLQMKPRTGIRTKDPSSRLQPVIKSLLAERDVPIIAATTPESYFSTIRSDEMIASYFVPVVINEPTEAEMMEILAGVKVYFEKSYGIKINRDLFKKIYFLGSKFIPHRAFPHKAIDLLDVSCYKAASHGEPSLRIEFIYERISQISKLPVEIVKKDPQGHSRGILPFLRKAVINQNKALEEISRIIKIARLEMTVERTHPEGIFLFWGPTGVGKSFVASRIAQYLFGSVDKLRVIDLAEYSKSADIEKLLREGELESGSLIRELENHPFSVILFENVTSAHQAVLDFLGKVTKKGEIIDSFGKKYYLSNIIFILSITQIGEARRSMPIGFVKNNRISAQVVIPGKIMNVLDWVDEIIEFSPLSEDHLRDIALVKLRDLKEEIKAKYKTTLKIDESVPQTISQVSLQSGAFAHSVSEFIERKIKLKLLDIITKPGSGNFYQIAVESDQIVVKTKSRVIRR